MTAPHCAVWIDDYEARIFNFDGGPVEWKDVRPAKHVDRHIHRDVEKHADEATFFHEVAGALREAGRVLVLGPSTAKLGLLRHFHTHDKDVDAKVIGVETVDHPTNPQLVAYAETYFARPGVSAL